MRRATRFKPDPLDSALVQFAVTSKFTPEYCALIINESYTGSALIVVSDEEPKKDQEITVRVGKMDAVVAKIVWSKELEPNIYKIGIQFESSQP